MYERKSWKYKKNRKIYDAMMITTSERLNLAFQAWFQKQNDKWLEAIHKALSQRDYLFCQAASLPLRRSLFAFA